MIGFILVHESQFPFFQTCHGDSPVHRDFHTATAVGHIMVIYGGRSSDQTHHLGTDWYSNKVTLVIGAKMKVLFIKSLRFPTTTP